MSKTSQFWRAFIVRGETFPAPKESSSSNCNNEFCILVSSLPTLLISLLDANQNTAFPKFAGLPASGTVTSPAKTVIHADPSIMMPTNYEPAAVTVTGSPNPEWPRDLSKIQRKLRRQNLNPRINSQSQCRRIVVSPRPTPALFFRSLARSALLPVGRGGAAAPGHATALRRSRRRTTHSGKRRGAYVSVNKGAISVLASKPACPAGSRLVAARRPAPAAEASVAMSCKCRAGARHHYRAAMTFDDDLTVPAAGTPRFALHCASPQYLDEAQQALLLSQSALHSSCKTRREPPAAFGGTERSAGSWLAHRYRYFDEEPVPAAAPGARRSRFAKCVDIIFINNKREHRGTRG